MPAVSSSYPWLKARVTPVPELVVAAPGDGDNSSGATTCHAFGTAPRPHREYEIEIEIAHDDDDDDTNDAGDPIASVRLRFSVFRERFLGIRGLLPRDVRAVLPARGWVWEDHAASETGAGDRATAMGAFLARVLNPGRGGSAEAHGGVAILRSARLWEALGLSPGQRDRLLRVAQRRWEADPWERAQSLGTTATTTTTTTPTEWPALSFSTRARFEITAEALWLGGHGTIRAAGGTRPWFRLERTSSVFREVLPAPERTFVLARASDGVPLLELVVDHDLWDLRCDVSYVGSDGRRTPALEVDVGFRYGQHGRRSAVSVRGDGPLADTRFGVHGEVISIDGREAAFLKPSHRGLVTLRNAFSQPYDLEVRSHRDCLVVLGIACAMAWTKLAAGTQAVSDAAVPAMTIVF